MNSIISLHLLLWPFSLIQAPFCVKIGGQNVHCPNYAILCPQIILKTRISYQQKLDVFAYPDSRCLDCFELVTAASDNIRFYPMSLILKTINLLHSYIQVRPCHLDIGIALCTGDDKIWILNPHFSQTVSSLWTTHPRSFVSHVDQNLVVDMRVVKAIWTGLPKLIFAAKKR